MYAIIKHVTRTANALADPRGLSQEGRGRGETCEGEPGVGTTGSRKGAVQGTAAGEQGL